MSIVQIVFSPTGGTQKVADIITDEWGMPVEKTDLSDARADFSAVQLNKEDIAVIALPSFGGRVPALATQRLEKIQGNQALCVLVCVYGNRAYEDTLIEMKDTAEKCGFRVAAGVAAIAEHSIMHQYATGRPDAADQKELKEFADKILDKIRNSASVSTPDIPGNHPYKKAGGAGLVPKADNNCIGCGLCVASCSGQAIFLVDENVENGMAEVTIPYEFLPYPEEGEKGSGLGRDGKKLCVAEIVQVKKAKAFDHTALVTMRVPGDMAMRVRFYKKD